VLLNFWASWCGPCRCETPDLQALSERQNAKLTVVGVNQQEDAAAAKQFMAQFNLSYPVVLDSAGDVSQAYRVSGLPVSFLIDPNGVVKKIYLGRISSDELRKIEAEEIS
jgi:thiol-disulfide isomerase/thioredoxin